MTRTTYQWAVGQKVIRSSGGRSLEQTVATIEAVTAGGRAKIGDEVFLPDGRRVGDATARREPGRIWGAPTADIAPASLEEIQRVERAERIRALRQRVAQQAAAVDKMARNLPSDPDRLHALAEKLDEVLALARTEAAP